MKERHGIFINYKREQKHLAGRIYDYFEAKGASPFMDECSMRQEDFRDALSREIIEAPYFLCLLTEEALEDLLSPGYEKKEYYKEIKLACEHKDRKRIFVLLYGNIDFDNLIGLPPDIEYIKNVNHYTIPADAHFFKPTMDRLYSEDISERVLMENLDWSDFSISRSNVWLNSRREIEKDVASLENRFGRDFVNSIRDGKKFEGNYIIKEINLVCYAANIILFKSPNYLDRRAYDRGLMFNIFTNLLKDPDFSFRLVINAPESLASGDAQKYSKLGNSSFEDNEELVFLSSYASVNKMASYEEALERRRFRFMVTDCVLPYAMFQITYKDGYEEYNHIKVDLYSCNLDSSTERRSMIIFQKNDPDNYSFFEKQIQFFNNRENKIRSDELINKYHEHWISLWGKNKPAYCED